MIGILIWTTEAETWLHLSDFRWWVIPIVFGLASLRWIFDGMVFHALTGHSPGKRVRPLRTAVIRLIGNLISVVVPVFVGVFSAHTYLLKREKLQWGESVAVTIMRAVLPVFLFLFNIPIMLWWRMQGNERTALQTTIEALMIPVIGAVILVAAGLFFPERIHRVVSSVVRRLRRDPLRIAALEEKLAGEFMHFSRVFRCYFREKFGCLAAACGWLLAMFAADSAVAISIVRGFGFRPDPVQALAFLFMIWPIVYLMPTPAGTGAFEFSYLGFYALFMPTALIGLAVLIVRIMLTYLPMIAGSVLLVREFRKDSRLKSMVMKGKFAGADA
ncbi:flippase-like domain-containing protein [bacterium]|nr:flippase-like domain-containing protein [bacterium]